jgi:hypothetical protein
MMDDLRALIEGNLDPDEIISRSHPFIITVVCEHGQTRMV